jgi:diguanylate cyclase (GGDEF)-like protein
MWHNTVLRDEDGEVTATLSSGLDITERRRADDRIADLAYHDGLTGLPNRALLGMHLELAIARARRADRSVALVYLDLDDFKLVNDSFGHATGDDLLREVCSRLEARRRASDLLARQGGDEFLLLIADVDGDAYAVARAAAEGLLGTLAEPFSVQGSEFHLRASVGISVFPRDADDAETLLRHADAAMYQAKTAGRGGVRTWSGEEDHPFERLSLTTRLRRALDRDELVLHWQPIVAPATGMLEGLEALVRWEDPDRGLVPPGDFLSVAEETGLIDPLGRWVLEEVCRQRLAWRSEGMDPMLSFNVSPHELRRGDFAADVLDCLRRHALEPEGLVVEITERRDGGRRPHRGAAARARGRRAAHRRRRLRLRRLVARAPAEAPGADPQARPLLPDRRALRRPGLGPRARDRRPQRGARRTARRRGRRDRGPARLPDRRRLPAGPGLPARAPGTGRRAGRRPEGRGRAPKHRRWVERRRVTERERGRRGGRATGAGYRPNVRVARSGATRLTLSRSERPNVKRRTNGDDG